MAAAARETERLILRRPRRDDIPALVALHSDPRVYEHSPDGTPTPGRALRMAHEFIALWREHPLGYWAVERDRALIGVAGVKPTELAGGSCWNLYFRFAPEMWGQGLATEASRAALQAAAQVRPGWPVVVQTRASNAGALGVARAIGMVRRAGWDHDGFLVYATAG